MLGNNSKEEAALYYLYMLADGEVTYSEEKIFDSICKELRIDNDNKKAIIERCRGLVDNKANVFGILIREKIDEKAGHEWFGLRRDASSLARIIWNLVNLGYADSFYSDEEKQIVNYLADKWSISSEVYQELIDIADTMLVLIKQKEWITSTFPQGSLRDKKEKEADVEIRQLLDDVKLTIEEVTM